jgi:kynurenine 3-monooxygenase
MAMFLARSGDHIHMLERGPDPARFSPKNTSSINITLCERGLAALEGIVPRSAVLSIAVPVDRRAIHHPDGTVGYQLYSAFGDALYCVSRDDLRTLLVAHAAARPNISIAYRQELKGFDPGTGVLEVQDTQNGERRSVAPRHLFAADGARSVVRRCMSAMTHFNLLQTYSDHGNLELRVEADMVPEDWKSSVCLRIWPRGQRMVIAFPNTDGSYTCTLHLPLHGEASFASARERDGIKELFGEYFPDLLPLMPDLEQRFGERQPIAMIMIKCSPWNISDEVVLVGDAAHGVWPSYGQGANATFESCELLARALEKTPRDQWEVAITTYAKQRRLDTDALADLCVDHFEELRDHVGSSKFLLLKTLERELSKHTDGRFRSLYEMVSFSRQPYRRALAEGRRQQEILEKLLSLAHSKELIESGDVGKLLATAPAWSGGLAGS